MQETIDTTKIALWPQGIPASLIYSDDHFQLYIRKHLKRHMTLVDTHGY